MGQEFVVIISIVIMMMTGIILGYVLSQLILGFLTLNLVTFLGTLSLIIIFGTLYFVLFWELKKRQSRSWSTQPPYPTPEPSEKEVHLQNRFFALVGDTATANRLIEQLKQNHPGMSENWYWQRAIADLERQRTG
ncbi:MAG: ABC transporter permease [Richelia sp. RM2_1_2]|nr:ABC transporter permease [Rivularia sp. T60_A2020_040]NJL79024.1 ABC transporter permease [Richelia sp. SM2_1_7]NJM19906.1 ABC transporter permease [Richelia sp. SM1_7_0]NJO31082.1 ABC transporter permease [Richelia sp. SL_2_1]NJO63737.1 ABC transporter permease [Richelia sp. RM2_1_2]